ncbi:MAG: hypothetical protein ABIZ52_06595 [Candidatus Limnocylindrales bacterium]
MPGHRTPPREPFPLHNVDSSHRRTASQAAGLTLGAAVLAFDCPPTPSAGTLTRRRARFHSP